MKSIKPIVQFNIIFWVVYYLYEWLANASVGNEYYRYFINASVIVPITMMAAMLTVHILFKGLYLRHQKNNFWILLIISMIVFALTRRAFNYYYTYALYYPEIQLTMSFWFLPKLIIECVNIYLIVALYSMFYFVKAWYDEQKVTRELLHMKTEAELSLLKAQVHPHFIFNTLNNIYSYAVRKQDGVPTYIHQLSSFLSYNLYDNKTEFVSLSKELEYIHNYIELEKLRYGERLDVSLNIYEQVDGITISPLLLLPLVENCFKHGFTSSTTNCWIRIDVVRQNDWLIIKIENSLGSVREKRIGERNGLGLENVNRRLKIIYPRRHEFKTVEGHDSYLVILKINYKPNEDKVSYSR